MADVPTRLSNAPATFEEGGLYGGGKGIIESIRYVLWDYDGNMPPDSVVAVKVRFQPKDGSNEGKPVDIFWSAGPAKEYVPDQSGGFLLAIGNRKGQSKASNWSDILTRFHTSCGMPDGSDPAHPCPLDGDKGILALEGTLCVLSRVDQKARDIEDEKPQEGSKKARKKTILAPTWAEFPWEKAGTKPSAPATAPAAGASTPAPAATPAAASANGSFDVIANIKAILTEKGAPVPKADFAGLMVQRLAVANVPVAARAETMKGLNALLSSADHGWYLDEATGTVMSLG